jgi:hypothetical protein
MTAEPVERGPHGLDREVIFVTGQPPGTFALHLDDEPAVGGTSGHLVI